MDSTEIPGKFTPERSAIAAQIHQARKFDTGKEPGSYYDDSSATQYEYNLNGLSHFFNYVRSLGGNNTVLDVGAGTTRPLVDFQSREIGRDINFIAAVLRRKTPALSHGIDPEKIFRTSSERLAGIEDNSVSGIISRSGMAYSKSPLHTIRSVDRVLIPGGVLKADFDSEAREVDPNNPYSNRNDYAPFVAELTRLGYDVAHESWGEEVVLAIKPGGGLGISASDLLEADEAVKGIRASKREREAKEAQEEA